jgi:hypothetical protein
MSMKDDQDIKSLDFKFKFSKSRSTQMNGKVERHFKPFYPRIRFMLNSAG